MKEELVSFETAKLLKEKGFSKTSGFMGWVDKFYHPRTGSILGMGRTGKCKFSDLYYAPTQSLAQKWLREKHSIHVELYRNASGWGWILTTTNTGSTLLEINNDIFFDTYEEALEEGLRAGLNLIK